MRLKTYHLKIFLNRWKWVLMYVILIFSASPLLPKLRDNLAKRFQNVSILYTIIVLFVVIIFTVKLLSINWKLKNKALFLYGAMMIISSGLLLKFVSYPIEKVHIIEYCLLSVLVYYALRGNWGAPYIYLRAVEITFLIGIFDELWQGLLPNRYFDVWDIFYNGASGIIGQIYILGTVVKKRLCYDSGSSIPKSGCYF